MMIRALKDRMLMKQRKSGFVKYSLKHFINELQDADCYTTFIKIQMGLTGAYQMYASITVAQIYQWLNWRIKRFRNRRQS